MKVSNQQYISQRLPQSGSRLSLLYKQSLWLQVPRAEEYWGPSLPWRQKPSKWVNHEPSTAFWAHMEWHLKLKMSSLVTSSFVFLQHSVSRDYKNMIIFLGLSLSPWAKIWTWTLRDFCITRTYSALWLLHRRHLWDTHQIDLNN